MRTQIWCELISEQVRAGPSVSAVGGAFDACGGPGVKPLGLCGGLWLGTHSLPAQGCVFRPEEAGCENFMLEQLELQ